GCADWHLFGAWVRALEQPPNGHSQRARNPQSARWHATPRPGRAHWRRPGAAPPAHGIAGGPPVAWSAAPRGHQSQCRPLHSRRSARYNSNSRVVAVDSDVGNGRFLKSTLRGLSWRIRLDAVLELIRVIEIRHESRRNRIAVLKVLYLL